MPPSAEPGSTLARTNLYQEIQEFYAQQMHAIDGGDVDGWTDSFTEDGVFSSNALPESGKGRAIIAWGAKRGIDERAAKGVVRRHLMTMLSIDPRDDGTVGTRSYVLVVETPAGGQSGIYISTVCEDVLVPADGSWLVRRRQVLLDSLL